MEGASEVVAGLGTWRLTASKVRWFAEGSGDAKGGGGDKKEVGGRVYRGRAEMEGGWALVTTKIGVGGGTRRGREGLMAVEVECQSDQVISNV